MKYCDWSCIYARFPKEKGLDGSNSCRTFQAVWCTKRKSYELKNRPCIYKKEKNEN